MLSKLESPSSFQLLLQDHFFILTSSLILIASYLLPFWAQSSGVLFDTQHHIHYGQLLYSYFENSVDNLGLQDISNAKYYGGFFDLTSQFLYQSLLLKFPVFKSLDIVFFRNLYSSLMGVLTLLFVALSAKESSFIDSWCSAFFSALILFCTPKFIGHTLFNSNDIPFALGITISTYGMVRSLKQLPKISFSGFFFLTIGLIISLGVSAGGFLIPFYHTLFSLFWFLTQSYLYPIKKEKWLIVLNFTLVSFGVFIFGYFLSLLFWPSSHLNPIDGYFEILKSSTFLSIKESSKILFHGEFLFTKDLPWFYLPYYLLISLPIPLLLGLFLAIISPLFFLTLQIRKHLQIKDHLIFTLFFLYMLFFPLTYAICRTGNIPTDFRSFLFLIPLIALLSGRALTLITTYFILPIGRTILLSLLFLSLIPTFYWMVVNSSNQLIYFNELSGGIKNIYNFDGDYGDNCYSKIAQFLITSPDIIEKSLSSTSNVSGVVNSGNEIKISLEGNPAPLLHYLNLAKEKKKVKLNYHFTEVDPFQNNTQNTIKDNFQLKIISTKNHLSKDLANLYSEDKLLYGVTIDDVTLCGVVKP